MNKFILRYGKTVVHFGSQAINELKNVVQNYGKVYIVTTKNAPRVSGALGDVTSILNELNITYDLFDEVKPNPSASLIEQIADDIRMHNPDVVIAIGGGSAIDSAKISSALAVCGGSVKDYLFGGKHICGAKPIIAVNLTHGTGSEVNRYAVVTIDSPLTKIGMASEYFYPMVSFNDPRYTLTMPHEQIVFTSLDAFYHVYEAATGRDVTPFALMLAEETVKLIAQWLPIAVKEPQNLEARYWLMYAAMLAGIAIDNSRAHLIHAIENVLSGLNTKLAHGAGLAILGPRVIPYLHRVLPENSYRLMRYLDPDIRPVAEDAEKAAKALARFQESVGFKESLRDYGFTESDAETIANTVTTVLSYSLRLVPFTVDADMIKTIYLESL